MSLDDVRPVRRIQRAADADYDENAWPYRLPPVRHLLTKGLDLPTGVTFLVGENGSGKSTIVEALAAAYGINPEGGSRGAMHSTRATESPLAAQLALYKSLGSGKGAYFLRAETMHGFYTYVEKTYRDSNQPVPLDERLHDMSHGESFLNILRRRFNATGFYLMDEPESALSFQSQLALLRYLDELARVGSQVVVATHSPVVASLPGAHLLEVGEHGLRETTWSELKLVQDWKSYLDAPQRYLRHLLD